MSSHVEAGGIVAAAVILPASVAFGAGWLAWKGGRLLVEANREADRQMAEKKREREEVACRRKMAAIAAHDQLVDTCTQVLSQLEAGNANGDDECSPETEQLKNELFSICGEIMPDDTLQIESLTTLGYFKLDKIVRQRSQIASVTMDRSENGIYQSASVADHMDEVRMAAGSMPVHSTKGQNVVAVNPNLLERLKLNEEFSLVTTKVMDALETIETLSNTYGITSSGSAWFRSCFNGVDMEIERLCKPTTSNQELKKGIYRLRDAMEQYETMLPSIEKDLKRKGALYKVYVEASRALGEDVLDIKAFKNSSVLEKKLSYLQDRARRAQECANIYKKLGSAAYMCYAWDQELKSMGYGACTSEKVAEIANGKPVHAKVGENKIPFYIWNDSDLTQLYSVGEQCDLQVIVHDDGSVSMQTIAEKKGENVIQMQRGHCSQLNTMYERLKKNWFISYDHEETESPEEIKTVVEWRSSSGFSWRDKPKEVTNSRERQKRRREKVDRKKYMQ